jgi:hypothetical protein
MIKASERNDALCKCGHTRKDHLIENPKGTEYCLRIGKRGVCTCRQFKRGKDEM